MAASADPVVFLAGQLSTARLWQAQAGTLGGQVLTLADRDTVAGLAGSVFAQAPDRFALAAHGMAGFVAFEMLRRQPQRIARLVLVSALAPADTPAQTARRENYIRLVQDGRFADIIEERLPALVHPGRTGDAPLLTVLRRMAEETGPAGFMNQQRAIMSRPDSRPSLSAIACPTLLVFGRADGFTTIAHQEEMLAAIPDVRLEIVEDSGHMVPLERPETVTRLLRAFLAA